MEISEYKRLRYNANNHEDHEKVIETLTAEVKRLRGVIKNAIAASDKLGVAIDDVLAEKEMLVTALQLILNSDGMLIEPCPILTKEEAYDYCVEVADNALSKMVGDSNV